MIPGQAQRNVSGFHSPFAPLILSVLITCFPLMKHGRQTWITREQASTTVISFHFEVVFKMVDLFSSHVCIMYVWLCEISECRKALCALSPDPQPCNAVQQPIEPESNAGLWNRQRHKSHLGLLQRKLLFCNKLLDGDKKGSYLFT